MLCLHCKLELARDAFRKSRPRVCVECVRKQDRERYEREAVRRREWQRKYNQTTAGKESSRRNNEENKKKHQAIKLLCLEKYGGPRCCWCGQTEIKCLSIDHINNDGAAHRGADKQAKSSMYWWLKKNDFPPGFEVLCMNCNFSKHHNGGVLLESLKEISPDEVFERMCGT